MSIELLGCDWEYECRAIFWLEILQIAEAFGWKPAGTLAPRVQYETPTGWEYYGDLDMEWSGGYTTGTLKEIADRLAANGMPCDPTFHVPVPTANLEMRIPFSVHVKCADLRMLSQHFVRILLDCDLTDAVLTATEWELHRLTDNTPQVQIAEAIFCYRLWD